jgi:hypothetical protein
LLISGPLFSFLRLYPKDDSQSTHWMSAFRDRR